MRLIYFLIFSLLLSCCSNTSVESYQTPNYEKIADRITSLVAQKIMTETGLQVIGTGGGMMDHIRMMALSFEHRGELTLEQARELLVYCIKEYLSAINGSEEVRPYLVHYPFTPRDIQMEIFISQINGKDVPKGALSAVNSIDGKLKYRIYDPITSQLTKIKEENYDEAVTVLETEMPFNKVRKNKQYTRI